MKFKHLIFILCTSLISAAAYAIPHVSTNEQAKNPVNPTLNNETTDNDNPKNFQEFVKQTKIDGYLRSYYFTRDYGNPMRIDQSAFSLGGALNVVTPNVEHWSGGASYYVADPLGLNSNDLMHVDTTLPGQSINVLGQAYLQYQNSKVLVRGGEQIIKTPWLNDADTRMIPASYNALLVTVTPLPHLNVTVFRQFRYKSRVSKQFSKSNLYDPTYYSTTAIQGINESWIIGTFAAGMKYDDSRLTAQAWYYTFFNFGKLVYADASYSFNSDAKIYPSVGVQAAKEWGDGKNALQQLKLGKTDAGVVGLVGTLNIYDGQITLAYDHMPKVNSAFRGGDFVSPYTAGYIYDPLFTGSMVAGLVEKDAGDAYKLSGNYYFFDKQLKIIASYAKYFTAPTAPNTNEVDFEVMYKFNKTILKGLSIRERVGVLNGNPIVGRFLYNRVMLQYDFKFS